MMTILAGLELARRLEQAEAFAAESFARVVAVRRPETDVVVEDIAGGRAVFAGVGSPLTEAKAVGLHGPVTEADLDRMESVFFGRGASSRVVVCPLADASFIEGLARRGYRLSQFEDILARPLLEDDSRTPAPTGIEVHRIGPEEGETYARVVAPNFVGPGEPIDEVREMIGTMLGMAHASAFLASIDGVPVGGGAVLMHAGLALLAGAATLEPYRNRRVHAALHHARLAMARDAGCDLVAQGAQPGSTSQRNAMRRGLQVVYTRAILTRSPA